jgi:hypothetical protein
MDITNTNLKVVERFFKVPADANPILIRIINNLKENEFNKPFISNFVKSEGFPIWEHAKITIKKKVKSRDGNPDTLVIIPIIPDNGLYVKDILAVKITTELLYKLYEREAYALYGFDKDSNRISPNADDVVNQIIQLEKEIFSAEAFVIKDNRLFDYWPSTLVKPESFFIKASIAIQQVPTYDGGGDGPCTTFAVYWQGHLAYYLTTGLCNNEGIPSGGGAGGGLDGGPGWTDSPPTSGGGGSTSPIPPCGSGFERVVITPDGLYSGPCTSPTHIPADTSMNDNQFSINDSIPCLVIANHLQSNNYTSLLQTLRNKSNVEKNETGFLLSDRENAYQEVIGPTDSLSVTINISGRIIRLLHNHYIDTNSLSVFSSDDIINLYYLVLSNKITGLNEFTYTLVTSTTSYIIMIKDLRQFLIFGQNYIDTEMLSHLLYTSFNINENNTDDQNEIQMLKAFSLFNTGFKVFKGNSNMSEFNPVKYDYNSDYIVSDPCN